MYLNQVTRTTRLKVGIFTLGGAVLMWSVLLWTDQKPFWWRPCQFVEINLEDATGLKSKSAVRSLGIDIGYLKKIDLLDAEVRLGICITAPVEVLSSTRAYIRSEGFLGDKFVELKPIKTMHKKSIGPTSFLKKVFFHWSRFSLFETPAFAESFIRHTRGHFV